jgi:hypothetical protein
VSPPADRPPSSFEPSFSVPDNSLLGVVSEASEEEARLGLANLTCFFEIGISNVDLLSTDEVTMN